MLVHVNDDRKDEDSLLLKNGTIQNCKRLLNIINDFSLNREGRDDNIGFFSSLDSILSKYEEKTLPTFKVNET